VVDGHPRLRRRVGIGEELAAAWEACTTAGASITRPFDWRARPSGLVPLLGWRLGWRWLRRRTAGLWAVSALRLEPGRTGQPGPLPDVAQLRPFFRCPRTPALRSNHARAALGLLAAAFGDSSAALISAFRCHEETGAACPVLRSGGRYAPPSAQHRAASSMRASLWALILLLQLRRPGRPCVWRARPPGRDCAPQHSNEPAPVHPADRPRSAKPPAQAIELPLQIQLQPLLISPARHRDRGVRCRLPWPFHHGMAGFVVALANLFRHSGRALACCSAGAASEPPAARQVRAASCPDVPSRPVISEYLESRIVARRDVPCTDGGVAGPSMLISASHGPQVSCVGLAHYV